MKEQVIDYDGENVVKGKRGRYSQKSDYSIEQDKKRTKNNHTMKTNNQKYL